LPPGPPAATPDQPAPPAAPPEAPAKPDGGQGDGLNLSGKPPGIESGLTKAKPDPKLDSKLDPKLEAAPTPTSPQPNKQADTFMAFTGNQRVPASPQGAASPQQGGTPGQTQGDGTSFGGAGAAGEGGTERFDSPEKFPDSLKTAFEALAKAPFGTATGARGGPGVAAGAGGASDAATQALFKQYQIVPQELLKKNPAVFLFLNTVVGKYPPSEIRRLAEKNGIDLGKVVTALVLDVPAQPETIARLAGEHQLGAERGAVVKQAEQLSQGQDALQQLAGRFTKTVLGNNPQALQSMLTDPMTFFGAQLWSKLGREQQNFVADGGKTRKATGLLQRGGLSAKGLAWVIGDNDDGQQGGGQGGQGGEQGGAPMSANELQQQKAFYDNWRETLIKGIKESSDAKAGRASGPPTIETVPTGELPAVRAVYDPARKAVRLGLPFPECLRVHTHGLTLTVAPDGELLEIALRNPHDRWELKKDLATPVVAGLEGSRARVVAPKEGAVFPTHDRFYTSADRNIIYLQIEKRPIARRALAAANVVLELDEGNHLLGIVIWQLAASKATPPGDQKAWIAGLADRTPPAKPV
jgi:hypothetical protein